MENKQYIVDIEKFKNLSAMSSLIELENDKRAFFGKDKLSTYDECMELINPFKVCNKCNKKV